MPKLDLSSATAIKAASGTLAALKGSGFSWSATPAPAVSEKWVVTGHSIMVEATGETADPDAYGMHSLASDDGITFELFAAVGPYAAARFRYDNSATIAGEPDLVNVLRTEPGITYLVNTEGMSGTGLDTYVGVYANSAALDWHDEATTAGADAHYYLRWPGYNDSFGGFNQAWRDNITDVLWAQWDSIKTSVDANKTGSVPFEFVYLDAAFAVLFDRIQAGSYTEFTIGDFFTDTVHPSTNLGKWLAMVLTWCSIRGTDPNDYALTQNSMSGSITSAQKAELVDLIRDVIADPTIAQTATIPVISGVPTISGDTTEGQTLTATAASATGSPSPTRTWQWERAGTPISGATSSTYTLTSADAGQTLTVVQTETNSEGSDTAESSATATIVGLAAPTITGVPTIAGTTTEGETLTASPASVTGNPTPARTWQWERSGVAISGATSGSYTLTSDDVGETLTVVQTETNSQGADTAESTATATIAAAPAPGSWDVSGGTGEIVVSDAPTVTAPTATGGAAELTITG